MFKLITIILTAINSMVMSSMDCVFCSDEMDKVEWNPISAGPVTTWTAPICAQGKFVIQPFLFYNRTRGTFDGEGQYKSFKNKDKKSQYQQQLFAQYGLADRLEIDGQTVYQKNLRRKDGYSVEAHGFGDSYIFSRYCIIEERGRLAHTSILFQLKLPTGKYQRADMEKLDTDLMGATSGGGSYDHGYGFNLSKKIRPFVLHADFIYNFPIEARIGGLKTRYANYINYDFGLEYFLPKGFNFMFECNGFMQGDKNADGELVPSSDIKYLNVAGGIGWCPSENIQALIAYQRTLAGTNSDVNDSFVFTFVHTF